MVEFYLLTFPRFPLRKKEHKSYFGKNRTHDFRTCRCAHYLLIDHSGDEGCNPKISKFEREELLGRLYFNSWNQVNRTVFGGLIQITITSAFRLFRLVYSDIDFHHMP